MKNYEVEKILQLYSEIDLDIKIATDMKEEIELAYNPLGAMSYDGMPKGGKISDSTATLGIEIARTDVKRDIEQLQSRIKELKKLRTEILKELASLKPLHKVIVIEFYIRGKKWERIAEHINYSVRQSKNIRCTALEDLGKKMARNRNISQSKIIKDYTK